ncbi:hypothetical protein M413DRAFT_381551 [Hebeloma cylindrosporum]|uniref:Uncharacterized protein n=1 Tax=Hebeloma cylindrosporum TaxID=76867 RepID=A0A0C2YQZ8_HEBCY|nr:hypothetical protein M413DRAFT_381551 [Hebeloma cylindrosporum h7]
MGGSVRAVMGRVAHALRPNTEETGMSISKYRHATTHLESQNCSLHDGVMCERRVGVRIGVGGETR